MKLRSNVGHTEEELRQCIQNMHAASDAFYRAAVRCGNHAFIEFTGLMNEYIKVCEQTLDAGLDFTESNAHVGGKLLVHSFNAMYMAEKFGCIFETTLADATARAIFLKAIGGEA